VRREAGGLAGIAALRGRWAGRVRRAAVAALNAPAAGEVEKIAEQAPEAGTAPLKDYPTAL
jgi:hypothetical protein